MCNRYAIENPDSVERWIKQKLDPEFVEIIQQIGVKFTASPTNFLPVIVQTPSGKPQVHAMKWGVWFVNADGKKVGPYMNAKKELALKNWREPVQNRRCIVPADAFFEWPPDPPKTPWMFRRPGNEPFAFAGIFTPDQNFAFLTTTPNALTASIGHRRSPVILTEENVVDWLRLGGTRTRSRRGLRKALCWGNDQAARDHADEPKRLQPAGCGAPTDAGGDCAGSRSDKDRVCRAPQR